MASNNARQLDQNFTHTFPELFLALCNIRQVRLVNPPGSVDPARQLVEVAAVPAQQREQLFQLRQVQPDGVSIQRHFSQIGFPVQDAKLFHLTFNRRQFFLGNAEIELNTALSPGRRHRSGTFFMGAARTGDFFPAFSCACLSCARTAARGRRSASRRAWLTHRSVRPAWLSTTNSQCLSKPNESGLGGMSTVLAQSLL